MNPIDQLKSVLCGPEGKCCIAGSDEDRAIVDRALEALAQQEHPEQMARLGWQYVECPACGSEGARAFPKPEEQPVAWGFQNSAITGSNRWMMLLEDIPANDQYGGALWTPLYTLPPQRQPLTDAEIWQMVNDCSFNRDLHADKFARAIEAKLKEKNT